MFMEQPGLGHMKEVARTLILEATLSDRIALLPPLIANHEHNQNHHGILNWSNYYDWSKLPVNDPKLLNRGELKNLINEFLNKKLLLGGTDPDLKLFEEDLIVRFFQHPSIFGEWFRCENFLEPDHLKEPTFSDMYPYNISKSASEVVSEIGIPKGVIHIRRGDLACPKTDPPSVIAYLLTKGVLTNDKIFVLTNESSLNYRDSIRNHFPSIVFEQDVKSLQYADNYKIFRIGKFLQSRFDDLELGTLRFMKESYQHHKFNIITRISQKISSATHQVSGNWIDKLFVN